MIVDSNNAE